MMMFCRTFLKCRSSCLQVGKLGLGQFADRERFLGNDDGTVISAVLDEIQPLIIEGFGYRIHAITDLYRIRHGIPQGAVMAPQFVVDKIRTRYPLAILGENDLNGLRLMNI